MRFNKKTGYLEQTAEEIAEAKRMEAAKLGRLQKFLAPGVKVEYNAEYEGVLTLTLPDGKKASFSAVGDDATYMEWGAE